MDTPSPADEGEPGNQPVSPFRFSIVIICLVFLTACNRHKKEQTPPPAPPSPDTATSQKPFLPEKDTIPAVPLTKKKVYLTFDDGPNKGTLHVLNAVKQEAIPVSFFIVGKHVFDSPEQKATWELLKADTTVELCNHSFSHAANRYTRFYENPAGVVKDLNQCRDKLQFNNAVARMPGRNAWRIGKLSGTDIKESKAAIDSVHAAGYQVMGWDIEWRFDHKTLDPDPDTALLLRRMHNLLDAGTTKTPGHLVLLAHDQSFQKEENIAMLVAFLQELKRDPEYEFVLAGKYPGVK